MNKKNKKQFISYAKKILASDKNQRKHLIRNSSPDFVHFICSLCKAFLKKQIVLSKTDSNKLRKDQATIKFLARTGNNIVKKQQVLTQKGNGIFSLLIPAGISLLSSLFSK